MNLPYRFKVIFLSFLAVSICYIDRVNISVAIIPMQEQFEWSEFQIGIILSSFYFGYMFTLIVGGYLADKYGGKKVLGYGLLIWSFFTIITPFFAYSGLWWLIFIRILMGLGEGITFPSWHAIYARWIPFNERTRAVAFTNSGIAAGTVFGYAVAALIIAAYSWEWVFYLFGILGIFWYFFWNKSVTSFPENNKNLTENELKLIQNEAPCVVAILSLVIGGYLADGLIKRGYAVIKVRKTVNSIGFFGSALFLLLISSEDSLFNVVLLLSLINVCSGICAGGFGVNHADLGPKYTGSLVGISGSIGMIAAILSPIVAGTVLQITNSWSMIFYICAGMLIFGGIFYLIFASANKQFD